MTKINAQVVAMCFLIIKYKQVKNKIVEQLTSSQIEYIIGIAIGFIACAALIINFEIRRK